MLRLTLRDASDSRFLARIVERDGFAFVLDYGDDATISDANNRINRGFSVSHQGQVDHVTAGAPDLLEKLALYYLTEGLDVSLERPMNQLPGKVFDDPNATSLGQKPILPVEEHTELVTLESVALEEPAADAGRAMWVPEDGPRPLMPIPLGDDPDEEDEEAVTELVPEEMRQRALSGDEATERHSVAGVFAAIALAEEEDEHEEFADWDADE